MRESTEVFISELVRFDAENKRLQALLAKAGDVEALKMEILRLKAEIYDLTRGETKK